MKLAELAEKLPLQILSYKEDLRRDVSGGYVSDMLSDVLANSAENNIWITLQTHANIVAVASLKNLAGIIIVNDRRPDEETLAKASAEKTTIMTTRLSAFEAAGMLFQLLRKEG